MPNGYTFPVSGHTTFPEGSVAPPLLSMVHDMTYDHAYDMHIRTQHLSTLWRDP
jgi:hypothetical protein